MRSSFKTAILALVLAGLSTPALSFDWKITKDRWSPEDEAGFSAFIQALGEDSCQSVDDCLASDANPFRDTDPPHFRLRPDCADMPYVLRAYYAAKNGLPFSYINGVSPIGSSDWRFGPNGNRVVARRDIIDRGGRLNAHAILQEIRNVVSTATFRVDPAFNKAPYHDFYSPKIQPGSIRPSTAIYDINGHAMMVYRVDPDGRIHYMDSHPDLTLTRSVYGPQIPRDKPVLGAGFKAWRPLQLVGARKGADGSLIGGRIVFATNEQIEDFSLEQYVGTDPDPSGNWEAGRFTYNGIDLTYWEYVRAAMSGGKLELNPIYELRASMRQLCSDLQDRAQAVDVATGQGIDRKAQPSRLPDNIYGTANMEWELYSTPSRDARLKTAFVGFRASMERVLEQYRTRDPRIAYDGLNLKADLLKAYDEEAARCRVTYINSNDQPVTLTFDTIVERLFKLSFDPYHCVERRWGATSEEELASCPDNSTKRAWYEAQQGLRNQLERTYDARMDFTLRELESGKPGTGAPTAPEIAVRPLIEGMGPRVPFQGMKPQGT